MTGWSSLRPRRPAVRTPAARPRRAALRRRRSGAQDVSGVARGRDGRPRVGGPRTLPAGAHRRAEDPAAVGRPAGQEGRPRSRRGGGPRPVRRGRADRRRRVRPRLGQLPAVRPRARPAGAQRRAAGQGCRPRGRRARPSRWSATTTSGRPRGGSSSAGCAEWRGSTASPPPAGSWACSPARATAEGCRRGRARGARRRQRRRADDSLDDATRTACALTGADCLARLRSGRGRSVPGAVRSPDRPRSPRRRAWPLAGVGLVVQAVQQVRVVGLERGPLGADPGDLEEVVPRRRATRWPIPGSCRGPRGHRAAPAARTSRT